MVASTPISPCKPPLTARPGKTPPGPSRPRILTSPALSRDRPTPSAALPYPLEACASPGKCAPHRPALTGRTCARFKLSPAAVPTPTPKVLTTPIPRRRILHIHTPNPAITHTAKAPTMPTPKRRIQAELSAKSAPAKPMPPSRPVPMLQLREIPAMSMPEHIPGGRSP